VYDMLSFNFMCSLPDRGLQPSAWPVDRALWTNRMAAKGSRS